MRIIHADDLLPNTLVTVHSVNFPPEKVMDSEGFVQTLPRTDRSFMGDILRVLVVDYPYVIVRSFPDKYGFGRCSLDLRHTTFAKPSREYVEAKIGKKLGVKSRQRYFPTPEAVVDSE